MRRYTRFVKTAHCHPFWPAGDGFEIKDFGLHYTALHAIYSHPLFPQPLFPEAKEVSLHVFAPYPIETMFVPTMALSPSVQALSLVVHMHGIGSDVDPIALEPPHDIHDESWVGLTTRIVDTARQLSLFSVRLDEFDEAEVHWIGKIPSIFDSLSHSSFSSSLETLDITPLVLTGPMLKVLQQLPKLDTLCISIFGFQIHELELPDDLLSFNSLTRIAIDTPSIPTCLVFLQRTNTPRLKSISLGCLLAEVTDPSDFFLELQKVQRYNSLESIIVFGIYNGDNNEPTWREVSFSPRFIFSTSTASSLRDYSNLTKLSITPCITLRLSDAALQHMFTAWPRLTVFEIHDDHVGESYQNPMLTLAGVHQALQSVPLLEKLTLAFNGSVLPNCTTPQSCQAQHQALKYWDVGSSSITLPSVASAWFLEHYPALVDLVYFTAYRDALQMYCWGNVVEEDSRCLDGLYTSAMMMDRWSSVSKHLHVRGSEGEC